MAYRAPRPLLAPMPTAACRATCRWRLRDRHWPVGARIATLEQLERGFGVARVTLRQTIDLLAGEGSSRVAAPLARWHPRMIAGSSMPGIGRA
jgi:hypothetical protein